ncbi:ribosome silencing factor [Minwuia sp.]|uniref:ribosome silencing factor n=1 Tax=Minwuia sp. TaxID=2493630 RepID=UPI003A92217C
MRRQWRTEIVSQDKADHIVEELLNVVSASLDDDKAEQIVQIDLAGKTDIADHMLIASGRSSRHVSAIAGHLVEKIKTAGFPPPKVEGATSCDWVLVDAGDVIVHLFRPEVRDFYNLEKMWAAELSGPEPSADIAAE